MEIRFGEIHCVHNFAFEITFAKYKANSMPKTSMTDVFVLIFGRDLNEC